MFFGIHSFRYLFRHWPIPFHLHGEKNVVVAQSVFFKEKVTLEERDEACAGETMVADRAR